MFQKIAVISFGFFILSGNLGNYLVFLPFDISLFAIILPAVYFVMNTLKKMSVHKSFFVIIIFLVSLLPAILYLDNDTDKMLKFLLVFFVLTIISPVILSDKQSIILFLKTLFITAIIIVALSVPEINNIDQSARLNLKDGNPIWLGRAVSIAALYLLVMLLNNKIKMLRFILLFVPTIFIMISTGSKGPLLALIIAFVFIYFGRITKFLKNKKVILNTSLLLLLTISIIMTSFAFFQEPFTRIIGGLSDGSASSQIRMTLYRDAIGIITEYPFGVGMGNFYKYSGLNFPYPHNLILEAFLELGWIAGTFLVLMIIFSFVGLVKAKGNPYYDIVLGIFIMAFINSMVSGDITSPKELYLIIPLGLNMLMESHKGSTNSLIVH